MVAASIRVLIAFHFLCGNCSHGSVFLIVTGITSPHRVVLRNVAVRGARRLKTAEARVVLSPRGTWGVSGGRGEGAQKGDERRTAALSRGVGAGSVGQPPLPSTEPFGVALGQGDNVTSPSVRTLCRPPSNSLAPPSQGPSPQNHQQHLPSGFPQLSFHPAPRSPHPCPLLKPPWRSLRLTAPSPPLP